MAGIELFFRILLTEHKTVILSSPPFITIAIAHLACRLKNKKYLLDIRDIYPDVYFAQGLLKPDSLIGKIIKLLTREMYENASSVITVTPGIVEKIKLAAPKVKKVELLINGFDSSIFKPNNDKYEKFTVIFHGNMGNIQAIPTILNVAQVLEHHSDIEFIFIGNGPQAELLEKCQLKNVRYLGPKDYLAIPNLISRAHIGFSARRDDEIGADAFPVKVFEYLGVGLPVILTPKAGVMTKLIPDGIFEFRNDEIKEMANKILELQKQKENIKISRDFSRQEVSRKILDLCNL